MRNALMPEAQKIIGDKESKELKTKANRGMKDGEIRIYSELLEISEHRARKRTPDIAGVDKGKNDPRNMIAHAGLEMMNTQVRKDGAKIYVRFHGNLQDLVDRVASRIKMEK